MQHTFKFGLFGKKVQMFSEGKMGAVVEKGPDVVCVYGTDESYQSIFCAIPLCHPKFLKGAAYMVEFCENDCAKVCVGELQIIMDYAKKKCVNNKSLKCYGSDDWGEEVQAEWGEL